MEGAWSPDVLVAEVRFGARGSLFLRREAHPLYPQAHCALSSAPLSLPNKRRGYGHVYLYLSSTFPSTRVVSLSTCRSTSICLCVCLFIRPFVCVRPPRQTDAPGTFSHSCLGNSPQPFQQRGEGGSRWGLYQSRSFAPASFCQPFREGPS